MTAELATPPPPAPTPALTAREAAFRVARARSDYLSVSRHWTMFADYTLAEARAWERLCEALREQAELRAAGTD